MGFGAIEQRVATVGMKMLTNAALLDDSDVEHIGVLTEASIELFSGASHADDYEFRVVAPTDLVAGESLRLNDRQFTITSDPRLVNGDAILALREVTAP